MIIDKKIPVDMFFKDASDKISKTKIVTPKDNGPRRSARR